MTRRSGWATTLIVLTLTALGACRETAARFISKAHLSATANACPNMMLAVGDSLRFGASVMISNAPGGMQGPFDNFMMYTTDDKPKSFDWKLTYPTAAQAAGSATAIGKAELTRGGILIAKDTGLVYVSVQSAGKNHGPMAVTVVPRVARFALLPRDTVVQVGDTVFLRADAELDGPMRLYYTFAWQDGIDPAQTRAVERVEHDPDNPTRPDLREHPVVAIRPGTARIVACFAGGRKDTATIRVSGEPRAENRNVPPVVRLTPMDTTIYIGDEINGRLRVVNARLMNGPYRWTTALGDGSTYSDSGGRGVVSAFGFERTAFVRQSYFEPGPHPVKLTVTDSAGRSTTVRATYTVVMREFEVVVLPDSGSTGVRLTGGSPDVAIVLIANKVKDLWPAHISGSPVLTRMAGVPPLLFGSTVFDPESDGRRRATRDMNGDGEPDEVFYLDKATLRRNGDLRAGRNRLVIGGTSGKRMRPGHGGMETPFWPPIRAVAEFDVVR